MSSTPSTPRRTKIPRLVKSPAATPASSAPSSPAPSIYQPQPPRMKMTPNKSFIPVRKRTPDKGKYQRFPLTPAESAILFQQQLSIKNEKYFFENLKPKPSLDVNNNNNPVAKRRPSSILQLSEPVTQINPGDIEFVDQPINLELERVRAALIGMIPPVQSTNSMERMKQRLDSTASSRSSIINPLDPLIAEDVLKTLAEEESLDSIPPPSYPSYIDLDLFGNRDQNSNIKLKENNTSGSGLSLSTVRDRGSVQEVGASGNGGSGNGGSGNGGSGNGGAGNGGSGNGKGNWPTDFIFKCATHDTAAIQSSLDVSMQDLLKRQPKRGSNKLKNIFSLRPPTTHSKSELEPHKNGEPYGTRKRSKPGSLESPHRHLSQDKHLRVEDIPADEVNDFFEMTFDPGNVFRSQPSSHSVYDDENNNNLFEEVNVDDHHEEKRPFTPDGNPCSAILLKDSTLILHLDTENPPTRRVFWTTLELANSSESLYGFVINCNYPALNHFYITPRKGLISPKDSTSVIIKSKQSVENYLSSEVVAGDRLAIKYFPSYCSDIDVVESRCAQLTMENPVQISTQKINQVVLWDGGDFLRINDFLDSSTSQLEQSMLLFKRRKLYSRYTDLILPHVRSKSQVNSLRMRMLLSTQQLKDYLQKIETFQKALHVFSFLCMWAFAFMMILPFVETDVVVGDVNK